MRVYSVQFSGEIRVVDEEIQSGESPVDAAKRLMAPLGVQVYDIEDAYEIQQPGLSS